MRRLWRRLFDSSSYLYSYSSSSTKNNNHNTDSSYKEEEDDEDDDVSVISSITMDPAISTPNVLFADPQHDSSDGNGTSSASRVLLAVSNDADWLSDADCMIRQNMEVFYNHNGRGAAGRVGMRCIHCPPSSYNNNNNNTKDDSILYPRAVETIHEETREFAGRHFTRCPHMPPSLHHEFVNNNTNNTLPALLKRHSIFGARVVLGLENASVGNGVVARVGSVLLHHHDDGGGHGR